jgi:NTP pyrophosphatase (non-canonical NTP hydrolase)
MSRKNKGNFLKSYEVILSEPPYEQSLNGFSKMCHQANALWWRDINTGELLDRNKGEMLMLIVSEIAEALEGERKDLMDDHLPHRKMVEVELVDALIRIFDYAGAYNMDLSGAFKEKMAYNRTRKDHSSKERLKPNGKRF